MESAAHGSVIESADYIDALAMCAELDKEEGNGSRSLVSATNTAVANEAAGATAHLAETKCMMIDINRCAGELMAQMTAAHDLKKFQELEEKALQLILKLDGMELLTIPDLFHMRKDVVSRLQKCSNENEHRLKTCTYKTYAAATTTTTKTTVTLIAVRAPT